MGADSTSHEQGDQEAKTGGNWSVRVGTGGARCEVRGARCGVRGAGCEVRGARCGVRGAGCAVWVRDAGAGCAVLVLRATCAVRVQGALCAPAKRNVTGEVHLSSGACCWRQRRRATCGRLMRSVRNRASCVNASQSPLTSYTPVSDVIARSVEQTCIARHRPRESERVRRCLDRDRRAIANCSLTCNARTNQTHID
jgi:hypothetical protein